MTEAALAPPRARTLLNAGCGQAGPSRLPACLRGPGWHELRLDIDPCVAPDIVGDITDLAMLGDASVDALWSSHNLEHLHGFEVAAALAEFRRVLRPDGFALITLPDLRAVAREIAANGVDGPLYQSAAGPIGALDVVFGHQASLAAGARHMAHRTGFTAASLGRRLIAAGFAEVRVHEGAHWDLWALACLADTPASIVDELADLLR